MGDSQRYHFVDEDLSARIAVDKARIAVGDHMNNCRGLERLEKRLDAFEGPGGRLQMMENTQVTQGRAIESFIAERNFKRWALPILVGCCGSSVAAVFVSLLVRQFLGH
jgi:hypothetical protein